MSKVETQQHKENLKVKMQDLALSITQESVKFYPPNKEDKDLAKSNVAISMACLRAIKFKQKNPMNILDIIKAIKMIRRELKKIGYKLAFVNDVSLYLVQAFMRAPKN